MPYLNFRNPNTEAEAREKRVREADERRDMTPSSEISKIKELKEREKLEGLEERFNFDSSRKIDFKYSDGKRETLTAEEGSNIKKKIEISKSLKEEARDDDIWVDENVAKDLDLSDYRSEENFEKLTGLKLDEIREDKSKLIALSEEDKRQLEKVRQDYAGNKKWREFVKKSEKKLDFLIKFHPEKVQFVNAEGY